MRKSTPHARVHTFTSSDDRAPINLAVACAQIPSFNILPVYGVNCLSLIKYETVVMSVDAVLLLERRMLEHMHRASTLVNKFVYRDHKERILREAGDEFDPRNDMQSPFV
jgi:large subunit ribosomal protein L4